MKITIAKHAGYCWGVKRSYKKLLDAAQDPSSEIVTLGPLIHNPQTIDRLRTDYHIDYVNDPADVAVGRAAIRTHGIKPQVVDELSARGVEVLDLTCPLVRVIQKRAEKLHRLGHHVVIVGSATHPEIISITGYVPAGDYTIVEKLDDVRHVPLGKPIGVVCQSTHMIEKVEEIVADLQRTHAVVRFENTICFVTTERQEETKAMATECDAILVVGGKDSANTEKLRKTALEYGAKVVVKIEDPSELTVPEFKGTAHLGLLAGASTPYWLIAETVEKIRAEIGEPIEIIDLTQSDERLDKEAELDATFM